MTSQSESANIEALRAEAKALGVKGTHLMRKEETLNEKIAEAKAEGSEMVTEVQKEAPKEAPRKVAPRMNVSNINEDSRTKLLNQLEAENPEYTYKFQACSVSDSVLSAKGFERTSHTLKNDIVVRTMKDSFVEYQEAKNTAQRRMMDSIDTEGTKIKSHKAQAKDPMGK